MDEKDDVVIGKRKRFQQPQITSPYHSTRRRSERTATHSQDSSGSWFLLIDIIEALSPHASQGRLLPYDSRCRLSQECLWWSYTARGCRIPHYLQELHDALESCRVGPTPTIPTRHRPQVKPLEAQLLRLSDVSDIILLASSFETHVCSTSCMERTEFRDMAPRVDAHSPDRVRHSGLWPIACTSLT